MSIDDKLGVNRFFVDKNSPHISINKDFDDEEKINELIMSCPAGLYSYENGKLTFNYEGCLECGTCRVLSRGKVVKSWSYPIGGKGIEFQYG